VVLTYQVYAHERKARTNWVEDSFALINGASTYISLVESLVKRARRPHEVTLELPTVWSQSLSALLPASDRPHHYRAPDFDALVDSPILAGNRDCGVRSGTSARKLAWTGPVDSWSGSYG
jgi:predicted metalloprotease with PDZ domain